MSSLQFIHVGFNENAGAAQSPKLSVRLSVSQSGPSEPDTPRLTVYLEDKNGEVPLAKAWDELVSLETPALVAVGSRQLLLGRDELEELERAGWLLLVERGHFPNAWRAP